MSRRQKKAPNDGRLVIKADVIAKFLSEFTWSEDYQGMQYVRLEMEDKSIESLTNAMAEVKFIKYLNLNKNNIVDVSILQQFENLLWLGLNGNKVKNLNAFTNEEGFPKLKKLELANNKIAELVPITAPKIEYLDLSGNNIDKFESWAGHETIRVFKAVDNKIKNLSLLKNMPALEEAYLANNPISQFNGWEGVGALKTLHLRGTKIDKVEEELPELPAIETLNFRATRFNSLDNLKNVFQFTTLRDLNILDTTLESSATSFNMLLAEIMILYPSLTKYSKKEITEQHKYEGLFLAEYRWRKAEEERLRKEEEERLKAEAEGGD